MSRSASLPRSQLAALLGASSAATLGNMAQTTVLGLAVYQLTGSELDLGFLGLAEFAPAALLVVLAGAAVDRFDARRIASACCPPPWSNPTGCRHSSPAATWPKKRP